MFAGHIKLHGGPAAYGKWSYYMTKLLLMSCSGANSKYSRCSPLSFKANP